MEKVNEKDLIREEASGLIKDIDNTLIAISKVDRTIAGYVAKICSPNRDYVMRTVEELVEKGYGKMAGELKSKYQNLVRSVGELQD